MTARPLDAARDALIALQGQLIAMLAVQNAALAGRVGELEERLARLERAASRNSGNSSLPPSLDDQPGRTPVACQNSTKAPDLGFYPRRSCSFASSICS